MPFALMAIFAVGGAVLNYFSNKGKAEEQQAQIDAQRKLDQAKYEANRTQAFRETQTAFDNSTMQGEKNLADLAAARESAAIQSGKMEVAAGLSGVKNSGTSASTRTQVADRMKAQTDLAARMMDFGTTKLGEKIGQTKADWTNNGLFDKLNNMTQAEYDRQYGAAAFSWDKELLSIAGGALQGAQTGYQLYGAWESSFNKPAATPTYDWDKVGPLNTGGNYFSSVFNDKSPALGYTY